MNGLINNSMIPSTNQAEEYIRKFADSKVTNKFGVLAEFIGEEKKYRSSKNRSKYPKNYGLFRVHEHEDEFDSCEFVGKQGVDKVLFERTEKVVKGTPTICSEEQFQINFDIFTNGILAALNWNNVCLAGGSVLAMLTKIPEEDESEKEIERWFNDNYSSSDLDLFIYGN